MMYFFIARLFQGYMNKIHVRRFRQQKLTNSDRPSVTVTALDLPKLKSGICFNEVLGKVRIKSLNHFCFTQNSDDAGRSYISCKS